MAAFMEWNDKISVGIEEIDEQHKQLLDLINRLYSAMVSGEQKLQVAKDVLNELMQYTIVHFAVEESLFRIFNYPDYEEHCAHHYKLREQVIDINRKVQSGEKMVTPELLVFLRKWLTNHIMVEDKAYAPVLLERGLKKNWEKKSWIGKIWSVAS
ncbi:MAG: bacteriohemerythrin [Desulfuromonadales bacterium]|nr:bacteriohemerythrin [Desulfuromonadales bacterium]MDW7756720.1 bacteriohemerythrin [Desulfuromonadales bacterium]